MRYVGHGRFVQLLAETALVLSGIWLYSSRRILSNCKEYRHAKSARSAAYNPREFPGHNGFYNGASARVSEMLRFRDVSQPPALTTGALYLASATNR
jgi:hypothetical protein